MFATRDVGSGAELLVFEHPTAGWQVPAGTVERGESFEVAALRELHEETGVMGADARLVLTEAGLHRPDVLIVAENLTAFGEPREGAHALPWAPWRGWGVFPLDHRDGFTLIEVDRLTDGGARIQRERIGWVRTASLAARTERHFFQVPVEHHAAEPWVHRAEDLYDFACRWVPVRAAPRLIDHQQSWLERCVPHLR